MERRREERILVDADGGVCVGGKGLFLLGVRRLVE